VVRALLTRTLSRWSLNVWTLGVCCLVLIGSVGCSNRQEFDWADYRKVAKTSSENSRRVPPNSFGSGAVPYGSGMMPYGSGMMPYGSGMMPYGSGMMPYGSGMMPYGSGMMPYGSGMMPYGSGAIPFGTGASMNETSRFRSAPATSSVGRFPKFGSAYPTR
jgi:hypothetical protein